VEPDIVHGSVVVLYAGFEDLGRLAAEELEVRAVIAFGLFAWYRRPEVEDRLPDDRTAREPDHI
jgi:hypothetical protein